ncbi:uncharacterized protein CEXT_70471 [Caerostris extrusa]|uniref:Uncharacterized protein n=1 Tax=Caerostris extrusa TaxID=172846 RepID=A0AAV4WKW9_CAEEX|nr:uncharacterized protein CEXT_70471 [Caerostris extrusa]
MDHEGESHYQSLCKYVATCAFLNVEVLLPVAPDYNGRQSIQQEEGKKRKSYIKDGVVLKVSDIERECDRLRRRPRAALYPLLPITEPLKLKRKSIHIQKGRRRHTASTAGRDWTRLASRSASHQSVED